MKYRTISSLIGNTPLVKLQRLNKSENELLVKLEGDNPAGSVKDRAAMSMIEGAEKNGKIKPGDTIIEATSGNTGIALAMVCAIKAYKLILIMPDNMSVERRASMMAYGAEIILVTEEQGMEGARDLALELQNKGKGLVLNQFANFDNVDAHFRTTGPEIWEQTSGKVTHFIASMGTTGTIVGTSKYLKSMNPDIVTIGVQPEEGASIPGIRKWPEEYIPKIFSDENIDQIVYITQDQAESTARELAVKEGIFSGPSSVEQHTLL